MYRGLLPLLLFLLLMDMDAL
uniref:Uncharacterized protein n=1 Tax=Arundo donax TaxID=35708 RepID=A0A0A9CA16_ARUDO